MLSPAFLANNSRPLAAGFLLTFFGSFGQTFFIALFGGHFRAEFGLSAGGFGGVYAVATLASAAAMIYAGQLVDRVPPQVYVAVIVAGLAAAAIALGALPTSSVLFLGLVLFLLRLGGQGLMTHAAMTTMARVFDRSRGQAISFASIGHAAGEAVFPIMAVALIAFVGWRGAWLTIGFLLALLVAPLLTWLAGGAVKAAFARTRTAAARGQAQGDWTRRQVLRDPLFFVLLPATLTPPLINTGVFFHQVPLIEAKGWTLSIFAAAFATYAVSTVAGTLVGGRLVDRASASAVLRFALLPLAAGLLFMAMTDVPAIAHVYMVLAGVSAGIYYTLSTALWAEIYGVTHLGAIRALTAAAMVLSTALSPPVLGWLIDAGISIDAILVGCAAWTLAAAAPTFVAHRRLRARR